MAIRIAIDPGHGGSDQGANGGGMLEKKINWNVATKLYELLKTAGYIVTLTHNADENPSLAARAKVANAFQADLFVSVHHNAGGGHGYEIIYKVRSPKSFEVAQILGKEFETLGQKPHGKNAIHFRTNSAGGDYYGILRNSKVPAIICEYSFLDSTDVKDIDTLTEQWGEAKAIFNAIDKYFKR